MTDLRQVTIIILLFIGVFALGYLSNDTYRYVADSRIINGIHIQNANYSTSLEIANTKDKFGDWVCVNVRGMTATKALNTCNHEVAHEIFAEYCEDNITKCLNITE